MNEKDYAAELYDKMKAEQDKYREWLLTQEPNEILNHTYEYTMREDIVIPKPKKEVPKVLLLPDKSASTDRITEYLLVFIYIPVIGIHIIPVLGYNFIFDGFGI